MHVHPIQEERFEVTEGTMRIKLGGKQMIAHPGDVVVVPPGVRHKFANASDEEARARVEVRPAPGRVNIFERWESQAAVKAFRRSAPRNKQGAAMLSASVAEYDIADVRHLFGERTP